MDKKDLFATEILPVYSTNDSQVSDYCLLVFVVAH